MDMNLNNVSTRKPFILLGIIFFIIILILVFVLEMRMFRQVVKDYDSRIEQIAINDIYSYIRQLEYMTKDMARNLKENSRGDVEMSLKQLKNRHQQIKKVDVLDKKGQILFTSDVNDLLGKKPLTTTDADFFFDLEKENSELVYLALTTPLAEGDTSRGFLRVYMDLMHLKTEILLKYSEKQLKIALFDYQNKPLIWPFSQEELRDFSLGQAQHSSNSQTYRVEDIPLTPFKMKAAFFFLDTQYFGYKFVSIVLLAFALYFLVYQFIVEVFKINTANSYFENIDFEILNHLNEGIIIANRFEKIVFANRSASQIFYPKQIVSNKSRLRDIIGNYNETEGKITLRKSENQLEINLAPIFKEAKLLGTLVVISISRDLEKFLGAALHKLAEASTDGLLLVDQENRIILANMMAKCYFGNLTAGVEVDIVDSELARIIRANIGNNALCRARHSDRDILCELIAVYHDCGTYLGTLVLLKSKMA